MTDNKKTLRVVSVNISRGKGTVKSPVPFIELDRQGVKTDAHAGDWHRQVSLLGQESVSRFSREAGREIGFGEFAENITTEGLELVNTMPLDRLVSTHAELEVTQIGKKCHGSNCSIYREVGNCVMPKEGIFARVIREGRIQPGDVFEYHQRVFNFEILTLSDRAYQGRYEDKSGPAMEELIRNHYSTSNREIEVHRTLIPDDATMLQMAVSNALESGVDFLITTGGTGIGPRDITVDTIRPMIEKEIPGIMELIRLKYGAEKPNALLSRSVAGLTGNTFIYTLPGSVRAVSEYLSEILKTNDHLVYMLNQLDTH
jgi:molybdopterin adenylyltransferase